jgi:hypothetical protein
LGNGIADGFIQLSVLELALLSDLKQNAAFRNTVVLLVVAIS